MSQNFDTAWPELGWSDEITSSWSRGPQEDTARLLDRALEIQASVPYRVTLRWLFYNLWQEGWFVHVQPTAKANAKKRAYQDFSLLMSRLRHSSGEYHERWPIELADDRRDPVYRSEGFASAQEWLDRERERLACVIDKMSTQDFYILVAFEAEAMLSQFEYLTEAWGVDLWPFSGNTSIPYKKRLARAIEWASTKFAKPVIILYFGDYDPAGLKIPESAFRHVRKWARCSFEAYRVGLNAEHIERYNVPEDPEHPGKYQWEALNNTGATELVTSALSRFLYQDKINELRQVEGEVTELVRSALGGVELR